MSLRLSREVHRWSRWYPKRWCEENGAAMLGTFLDVTEAENRDRLSRGEKAAMVVGGLAARVEIVVPHRVQGLAASMLVGLLGAFAVFTGVVFEWVTWGGAARSTVLEQIAGGHVFGPFLSPFVIVAGLAITSMLACVFVPGWAYRFLLGATVVACVVVVVLAHDGAGGFTFLRSAPPFFAGVVATLCLLFARPNRLIVMVSGGASLALFLILPAVFGPVPLSHVISGYPYGAPAFFDIVVTPATAYFGGLLALVVAIILMVAHRPRVAAAIVLVSIPFAAVSAMHGWYGRDPIYLVVLGAAFAAAAAVAVARSTRRRAGFTGARSRGVRCD